jgi:hypothetical protein
VLIEQGRDGNEIKSMALLSDCESVRSFCVDLVLMGRTAGEKQHVETLCYRLPAEGGGGGTPWSESVSELYRPSDRRLSAK